jgi:type II secretory pathway predicted ATPase ExeA
MSLLDELQTLGVDTDDALKRFMNNSSLYERMLKKLPKNVESLEVMPYLQSGDYAKALENAHTLKGVMGNLSIAPLYQAYTDAVALLRADDPSGATRAVRDAIPVQDAILACIARYQ